MVNISFALIGLNRKALAGFTFYQEIKFLGPLNSFNFWVSRILLRKQYTHVRCSLQFYFTFLVYLGLIPSGNKLFLFRFTDGEHFFLDPDAKLSKVAPAEWKDPAKKGAIPLTFTTYFRVMFYVEQPNTLQ